MPLPIITTAGSLAVAEMLSRAQSINVLARQADAERRILIMQENWRHLVLGYINAIYSTDVVKRSIARRIKRTYNVLQQLCRRVCVAYKIPPLRHIDGTDEQQRAFADVLREASIATRAKTWERYAFACNVVIVVPRVVELANGMGRRLSYDMILPDRCEVYTDDDDPMGDPVAIEYTVKSGSDHTGTPLQRVILDDKAWHYYDHTGVRTRIVEHGAGIFPGAVFRTSDPVDDWWDSHRGDGIVDATIEVAHLAARMDWVRHGQDRKKEVFFAEMLNVIPQQVAGAEGPVQIPLPPGVSQYNVLDVNTSITNHQDHIKAYIYQAAESIGVPAALVSFDFNTGAEAERTAAQQASLADVREENIEWYRKAEEDLHWKTALVMRGMGHPLASQLPPDLVHSTFRVSFPDLLYIEEPSARLATSEKRVQLGLSSTIREYRRENPSLTFDEARAQVLAIATEEGDVNQFYIDNNISRDPATRLKTLAQLQGQAGGLSGGVSDDAAEQPGRDAAIPDTTADAAAEQW